MKSNNLVFYQETEVKETDGGVRLPGWYFWDEAGAYAYGPYQSKEEAKKNLDIYAKDL
jgi:hypothetical protein